MFVKFEIATLEYVLNLLQTTDDALETIAIKFEKYLVKVGYLICNISLDELVI